MKLSGAEEFADRFVNRSIRKAKDEQIEAQGGQNEESTPDIHAVLAAGSSGRIVGWIVGEGVRRAISAIKTIVVAARFRR